MKTVVLALMAALHGASAFAHTSMVPHEHPHGTGMLPDALALVIAAVLVGASFVILRRFRKE